MKIYKKLTVTLCLLASSSFCAGMQSFYDLGNESWTLYEKNPEDQPENKNIREAMTYWSLSLSQQEPEQEKAREKLSFLSNHKNANIRYLIGKFWWEQYEIKEEEEEEEKKEFLESSLNHWVFASNAGHAQAQAAIQELGNICYAQGNFDKGFTCLHTLLEAGNEKTQSIMTKIFGKSPEAVKHFNQRIEKLWEEFIQANPKASVAERFQSTSPISHPFLNALLDVNPKLAEQLDAGIQKSIGQRYATELDYVGEELKTRYASQAMRYKLLSAKQGNKDALDALLVNIIAHNRRQDFYDHLLPFLEAGDEQAQNLLNEIFWLESKNYKTDTIFRYLDSLAVKLLRDKPNPSLLKILEQVLRNYPSFIRSQTNKGNPSPLNFSDTPSPTPTADSEYQSAMTLWKGSPHDALGRLKAAEDLGSQEARQRLEVIRKMPSYQNPGKAKQEDSGYLLRMLEPTDSELYMKAMGELDKEPQYALAILWKLDGKGYRSAKKELERLRKSQPYKKFDATKTQPSSIEHFLKIKDQGKPLAQAEQQAPTKQTVSPPLEKQNRNPRRGKRGVPLQLPPRKDEQKLSHNTRKSSASSVQQTTSKKHHAKTDRHPKTGETATITTTTTTTTTTCEAPEKAPEADKAIRTGNQTLFMQSHDFWQSNLSSFNDLKPAIQALAKSIKQEKSLSSDEKFREELCTFLKEKLTDGVFLNIFALSRLLQPNALTILTESLWELDKLFTEEPGGRLENLLLFCKIFPPIVNPFLQGLSSISTTVKKQLDSTTQYRIGYMYDNYSSSEDGAFSNFYENQSVFYWTCAASRENGEAKDLLIQSLAVKDTSKIFTHHAWYIFEHRDEFDDIPYQRENSSQVRDYYQTPGRDDAWQVFQKNAFLADFVRNIYARLKHYCQETEGEGCEALDYFKNFFKSDLPLSTEEKPGESSPASEDTAHTMPGYTDEGRPKPKKTLHHRKLHLTRRNSEASLQPLQQNNEPDRQEQTSRRELTRTRSLMDARPVRPDDQAKEGNLSKETKDKRKSKWGFMDRLNPWKDKESLKNPSQEKRMSTPTQEGAPIKFKAERSRSRSSLSISTASPELPAKEPEKLKRSSSHSSMSFSEESSIEGELPANSLITLGILPINADEYQPEHTDLLCRLLSHKCSLGSTNQNTLNVILTGGEISFEIQSRNIKALDVKLQEKIFPEREIIVKTGGGGHPKTATGLVINPNMDRRKNKTGKRGSYHGQLKQTRDKTIYNYAKTLTREDYESLLQAETNPASPLQANGTKGSKP